MTCIVLFDKKIDEAGRKARIEYAYLEKKNPYDIGVLFAAYLFETEILELFKDETPYSSANLFFYHNNPLATNTHVVTI